MTIQRLPVVTSVDPEEVVATNPCFEGSGTLNVMYDKYSDERLYATQRQAVTVTADASLEVAVSDKGRGAYFWETAESLYIVNDNKIWRGYGNEVGVISVGRDPVYLIETTTRLVILDPENNEGWYIDEGTPNVRTKISDANFPPNQDPPRTLTGGGVWLDGFLFVMDTEGIIWNSVINDATSWSGIDFITAERERDDGVYLAKHRDHIVAFGSATIEFFYDAGNAVGSPLQRRGDIFYNVGCIDRKSIFNTGEKLFFIGAEKSGTIGLYEVSNFKLNKISDFTIDRSLSFVLFKESQQLLLAGGMVDNHYLCYITFLEDGNNTWDPTCTFVFDVTTKQWSQYTTSILDLTDFPIVAVADKVSVGTIAPVLLLLNGDTLEFRQDNSPIDTSGESGYFIIDDYIEDQDDYVLPPTLVDADNIQMEIILGEVDFGTQTNKFGYRLEVIGTGVFDATGSEDIMVSWSDDHYNTFSTERSLSTTMRQKLTRLGMFKRRAHKIAYTGVDMLRVEALELDVRMSRYA